jgi:hypothetical protein
MHIKILFIFLLLPGFVKSQIQFEAITDAESILQGSTFRITFQLKNAEGTNFRPPDFTPFQVLSGPSRSMQTTIINGAMTSSIGYVYVMSGQKTGTFTIGSASIVVAGKTYNTRPINIKVEKAAEVTGHDSEIFIKAIVDKEELYMSEQFVLSYKLYTRISVQSIEFADKPALDAFHSETVNMLNNQVQREIYNGREYTTKILAKWVLFPVKTGKIIIQPSVFRLVKGENDPFGFGMPSLFSSQVESVASNKLTITVNPLPEPIPEHFSGAVGEMYFRNAPVNQNYTLHDAIHLSIQLQGDANFNVIKSDFIKLDSSFEISDSKASELIKVTDEPKMTKTRKYDYLIVPKKTGTFTLNPKFIYFNTDLKKYITLENFIPIQISHGNISYENKESEEINDLRREVRLEYTSTELHKDYRTWVLCCIPFAILLTGFYKRYAPALFIKTKKSIDREIHIKENELTIDQLEQLTLQKVRKKFPHIHNLVQFKEEFSKKPHEISGHYLEIIQNLEILKFSGSGSKEALTQLYHKIMEEC